MTDETYVLKLKDKIQNLECEYESLKAGLREKDKTIVGLHHIIDIRDKDISTLQTRLKILQEDNEKKNKEANVAISRLGTVTSESADKTQEINFLLEINLSLSRAIEAMSDIINFMKKD